MDMAADIFVELLTEGIQLSDSGLDKVHVKEDLQTHRDKNAKSRCGLKKREKFWKLVNREASVTGKDSSLIRIGGQRRDLDW